MLRLAMTFALLPLCSVFAGGTAEHMGFFQRDHAFGLSDVQLRYEHLLSETVFAGFPDSASLSFYELPSFTPERGVWMHPHGEGYLVVYARAQVSVWEWAGFGRPEGSGLEVATKVQAIREAKLIEFRERELPKALGKRIESAWHRAVFRIKGGEKTSGLDGVTYVFRAHSKERGRVSWDVWSPASKSLATRLSAVALGLGQFCESGSTQALETAVKELEKE